MEDKVANISFLQKIYQKCMDWIQTPYGLWVFFFIAFAESSFFPIPPDIFLIALCIGAPKKSFKFALICGLGSVLGGAFGYWLGLAFYDTIGVRVIEFYGYADKYATVKALYDQYAGLALVAAGFTPLPYKIFTIAAGAFKIDFTTFMIFSALARFARFFLVAALIYYFGAPIKGFIYKYFNILTVVFLVLLVAGFVLLKLVL